MKLLHLFLLLALSLTIHSLPAMAKSQVVAANGEDVALAFYKSADAKPNFEKWAMGSKAFKYQSVTEARSFIRKERQRLEQKWINLDRNGDLLTIRTTNPVDVIADMERDENDPEGYKLVILLDKTRKTFFPYTHMGDPYAVIPKNIESVLSHQIDRAQAEFILNDIKHNPAQGVVIDFGIKPSKAYTDKPHKIGKEDQWVLMGDVVSISISSKQTGKVLWDYGAQWYVSPKTQEVLDLHRGSPSTNK